MAAFISEVCTGLFIGNEASVYYYAMQRGITHVISLIEIEKLDYLSHEVIPIQDTYEENIEQLFDFTGQMIAEAIEAGGSVLVHCTAGVSRSAAIVAAYLVQWHRMSVEEALAVI